MKTRVLLVDDEIDFINYMAKRLRVRGMDVEVSYDAESALQLVEQQPFDVIVLDLLMPGMDGFEALQVLRDLAPEVPVIMLSGHGTTASAEQGMEYGAVEYLLKPCDFNTLCQVIARYAPAAGPPDSV